MTRITRQGQVDELAALLKGGAHPLRIRIMRAVAAAAAATYETDTDGRRVAVAGGIGPSGLLTAVEADRLGPPATGLGVLAYHVRILRDLGLLAEVRTEPRRGAIAHFYAPTRLGRRFLDEILPLLDTDDPAEPT